MLTPIKNQMIIIIIPDQLLCYKSIIKNARVIANNIVMLLHTFAFKIKLQDLICNHFCWIRHRCITKTIKPN